MKVKKLTLRNFRNIREETLEPDPQLNFLIGANGQGKTSFLEALGYLATLRSFRGAKTEETIQWGFEGAEIHCQVHPEPDRPNEFEADLSVTFTSQEQGDKRKTSRLAFINGKPYRNTTQYLSQRFGTFELGFHAVVFNPSDHDIVRGEPALRRNYLDRVISGEDIEYLKTLQKYQRILEQRNAILKAENFPSSAARELLLGFTEPMAELAAQIAYRRLEWTQRLATRLNSIAFSIAPKQPELRLVYASNWVSEIPALSISNTKLSGLDFGGHFAGHSLLPSLEILEQAFWTRLSALGEAEWRTRSSLVGPHRDDWSFYLGSQVLKGHGSQGEVRSALLALKLSEIELFRNRTSQRPLLLLDDFSSELDQDRRAFLLKYLLETDLQVFVTTTEDTFSVGRRFKVSNGKLTELNRVQHDEYGNARSESV